MPIKIQFQTDLEDVPYEVSRLLEDVYLKMQDTVTGVDEVSSSLREGLDLKDLQSHLEKLKSFISCGIKSLTRVEDAMSILIGFYQVTAIPSEQPKQPEPETPTTPELITPPETNNPDIEEFSDS